MMNNEYSEVKSAPVASDEISLKELSQRFIGAKDYLKSKWLIIILIAVLCGLVGYLYADSKKAKFTAVTTFVLEGASSEGSIGGLASMVGINVGGDGVFQADNVLEIYKSRTMIEKTLLSPIERNGKTELIVDRYISFKGLKDQWKERAELKNLTFKDDTIHTRLQDSILGEIVKDISTNYLFVDKVEKKPSIIKVKVEAPNEVFAKVFNDNIVQNVNDFYIHTKTKKSLENVTILQQKVDSVKAVLNNNIYSAAAVVDATPNLNPTRQVQRIAPMQRSQFSAEANKNILIELVKNLELSKISLRKETPLIQVLDTPVFPLEITTVSKVKGAIIGGMIGFIFASIWLLVSRFFRNIMSNEDRVVMDELAK